MKSILKKVNMLLNYENSNMHIVVVKGKHYFEYEYKSVWELGYFISRLYVLGDYFNESNIK